MKTCETCKYYAPYRLDETKGTCNLEFPTYVSVILINVDTSGACKYIYQETMATDHCSFHKDYE